MFGSPAHWGHSATRPACPMKLNAHSVPSAFTAISSTQPQNLVYVLPAITVVLARTHAHLPNCHAVMLASVHQAISASKVRGQLAQNGYP